MAVFDALIHDVRTRFGLGDNAAPLVREALALILGAEGGIRGFLALFKSAGFGSASTSWLGRPDAAALAANDVEKALGALPLDGVAHRLDVALPAVSAALAYALPKLVGLLTPNGVIPAALPAEVASFLTPGAHAAPHDDHGHDSEVKHIRPSPVTPGWLWPLVFAAAVGGAGWAVAPLLTEPKAPAQAASPAAPAASPAPAPAVAEAPKPAVPSTFSIANDGGVAVVSGAVRDGQTKASILDALKAVFGDRIKGDIAVDASRTDAPWLPRLGAALGALKVPGVHAAFEGETVKVGGAIVEADRETITASLKSVLGGGVTISALADAFSGAEQAANAKAATVLQSLKTGFSGGDLVGVLNSAVISFPYGKADLPRPVLDVLGKAAAGVKALPAGTALEIAGYTDNAGDPAANVSLSQQRADAVRGALVAAGAPSGALIAKGYGGASPVAPNDTEEGRFKNRRIEFHVLNTAATPAAAAAPAAVSGGAAPAAAPAATAPAAAAPAAPAPAAPAMTMATPPAPTAPTAPAAVPAAPAAPAPTAPAVAPAAPAALAATAPATATATATAAPATPAPMAPAKVPAVPVAPAPAAAPAAPAAPAPTAPATLTIDDERGLGLVRVSGSVHDAETRGSILDALKAVFGADSVKGDIAVDPSRMTPPWLANLREALKALRAPGVKATFDGAAVSLEGAVPSTARQQIAASLGSIFGSSVTVGGPWAAAATPPAVPAAKPAPAKLSVGEMESAANAKAAAAIGALKSGFSAADAVSALNLSVVNFATGSAEAPESVMGLLHDAAATLKALPAGHRIEIAGYTDNTGDPDANLVLSRQRAEAVRAVLIKDGAPEDMLVARGFGAADPVDSNDTEEGRFRNRRIEYHILKTP